MWGQGFDCACIAIIMHVRVDARAVPLRVFVLVSVDGSINYIMVCLFLGRGQVVYMGLAVLFSSQCHGAALLFRFTMSSVFDVFESQLLFGVNVEIVLLEQYLLLCLVDLFAIGSATVVRRRRQSHFQWFPESRPLNLNRVILGNALQIDGGELCNIKREHQALAPSPHQAQRGQAQFQHAQVPCSFVGIP